MSATMDEMRKLAMVMADPNTSPTAIEHAKNKWRTITADLTIQEHSAICVDMVATLREKSPEAYVGFMMGAMQDFMNVTGIEVPGMN